MIAMPRATIIKASIKSASPMEDNYTNCPSTAQGSLLTNMIGDTSHAESPRPPFIPPSLYLDGNDYKPTTIIEENHTV